MVGVPRRRLRARPRRIRGIPRRAPATRATPFTPPRRCDARRARPLRGRPRRASERISESLDDLHGARDRPRPRRVPVVPSAASRRCEEGPRRRRGSSVRRERSRRSLGRFESPGDRARARPDARAPRSATSRSRSSCSRVERLGSFDDDQRRCCLAHEGRLANCDQEERSIVRTGRFARREATRWRRSRRSVELQAEERRRRRKRVHDATEAATQTGGLADDPSIAAIHEYRGDAIRSTSLAEPEAKTYRVALHTGRLVAASRQRRDREVAPPTAISQSSSRPQPEGRRRRFDRSCPHRRRRGCAAERS